MRIAHPAVTLISVISSTTNQRILVTLPRKPRSRLRQVPIRNTLAPFAMAEIDTISTVSADEDSKFGFTRPEMFSTNLAGTVDAYDRHVFLCHKSPTEWASRVEEDLLPKLLSSAFKSRKDDMTFKTKLTVCEGGDSDGDVLIFPEMIKYKGLTDSVVDGFVDDVLVNGKPWASGVSESITGSYVFVCAHGNRDKRCGVCGPALIEKFKEEIELRGLSDQVFVRACSHIGGHKYAGNLIIYSPDSEGKIMGHWFGYVTPNDVPELLDQHIAKGEIIERLWRGQMGASIVESDKAAEQKLPNGKEAKKVKKHHEETKIQETKENVGGCCQGANGFSCCREPISEVSEENKPKQEVHGKCSLWGLKGWVCSWEQHDVLAAAAVVGAAATVAVAYSYYRRSG
ncbi:hypothetical protein SLEP1_g45258 [Rubroshorea leprosula]|uniref:Altered inheritance of mitochondria protein 32 n=1 Tax=Rubroshorea leprosula TaxID=152421 RepID=A0AAV5LJ87_9ROSI|nr:hypothetical protein SLEP1_g45258 [Rubroshorea leprosula]